MLSRLKTENTLMDAEIEELGIQLRAVNSSSEASRLSLHKAQSEKLRATAQVHALCRHVETARNARATKLVEVHALLEAQESRAREIEEREEKRKVAVELPRVSSTSTRDHDDRWTSLINPSTAFARESWPVLTATPPCSPPTPRRLTWTTMVKIG